VVGDLEKFTLTVTAERHGGDRNLWGVTFADDDRFYATAASRREDLARRGQPDRQDGERVARRRGVPVAVAGRHPGRLQEARRLPRASGGWPCTTCGPARDDAGETRSVDDQVEWLDDATVVYGLPREDEASASSDVWACRRTGRALPAYWCPTPGRPP
jgi:hypothetical protein